MPQEILDVDSVEVEHVERHRERLAGDFVMQLRDTPWCAGQQELLLEWCIGSEIPERPECEPVVDRIQDRGIEVGEQTLHQHAEMLLGAADLLGWAVEEMQDVWPVGSALDEAELEGGERQPQRVMGSLMHVRGPEEAVQLVQAS